MNREQRNAGRDSGMKKITSSQNPRIKAAIRLKSTRGRKTQQRVIVFGAREVMRAIQSGIQPIEVFLSTGILEPDEASSLMAALPVSAQVYDLPPDIMEKLRYGERRDGAVMIAQRPAMQLSSLRLHKPDSVGPPLVVILETIEKPGNIGAVLRSVDGAGASAVILVDPRCDVLHPNCIRASMGSVFTIPLAVANAREAMDFCQKNGLTVFSLTDRGTRRWSDVDWNVPAAVVLGNEAGGLTSLWTEAPCVPVSIPMQGISDSLNVSVAAAVALYEAHRQRAQKQD